MRVTFTGGPLDGLARDIQEPPPETYLVSFPPAPTLLPIPVDVARIEPRLCHVYRFVGRSSRVFASSLYVYNGQSWT